MKRRSLALFLLAYLSLDVGNPFMPGAVTFVHGHLEVIDAGRPPGIDLPVPDGTGTAGPASVDAEPARTPSRPVVVKAHPRRGWIPARQAMAPAAPASSVDDH
jgi:hypothetical protein